MAMEYILYRGGGLHRRRLSYKLQRANVNLYNLQNDVWEGCNQGRRAESILDDDDLRLSAAIVRAEECIGLVHAEVSCITLAQGFHIPMTALLFRPSLRKNNECARYLKKMLTRNVHLSLLLSYNYC